MARYPQPATGLFLSSLDRRAVIVIPPSNWRGPMTSGRETMQCTAGILTGAGAWSGGLPKVIPKRRTDIAMLDAESFQAVGWLGEPCFCLSALSKAARSVSGEHGISRRIPLNAPAFQRWRRLESPVIPIHGRG